MPDPYERHGQADDGWSGQPSRSQLRRIAATEDGATSQAVDDPAVVAKRAPGKKDPALCKDTHWKEPHQAALRAKEFGWHDARWQRNSGCGWTLAWSVRKRRDVTGFRCIHEEVCTGCGKILRDRIPGQDCPDFRPITAEERAAIDAELERRKERAAEWRAQRQPRPSITGPQGYRKRKGA